MEKDLKLLLIESMSSAAFAEEVARHIGDKATAMILDEFYNDVNRELDKRVKSTVDYYIEHYKQKEIQQQVDSAIRSLSKKEILEKLSH